MRAKRPGKPAGALEPLHLAYFTSSVVMHVAQSRGLFLQAGLAITDEPVTSSVEQFRALRDGHFDLVITSPDNVVAYRLTDNNPLGERVPACMLLGVDAGLGLSIMARPEIRGIDDLRGRTVAVDVPQSGFAIAMFEVLRRHGLRPYDDVDVVAMGATPHRAQALLEARCDATLLNSGHDIKAESYGCRRLARITDILSPYLGAVIATTDPWLASNRALAQRFLGCWRAAAAAVVDPAQRPLIAPVVGDVFGLTGDAARQGYHMLVNRKDGVIPDGRIDPEALATVLAIRAAGFRPDPSIDLGSVNESGLVQTVLTRRRGR